MLLIAKIAVNCLFRHFATFVTPRLDTIGEIHWANDQKSNESAFIPNRNLIPTLANKIKNAIVDSTCSLNDNLAFTRPDLQPLRGH
jgi:hypothetical protein